MGKVQITTGEKQTLGKDAGHVFILPLVCEFFRITLNFSLKAENRRLGVALRATMCYNSDSNEISCSVRKGDQYAEDSGIESKGR